jgi:hypothetical protein
MFSRCSCSNGEISIQLIGGLGNQLFQFALGTKLGVENNRAVIFLSPKNGIPNRLVELGLETGFPYLPLVKENKIDFKLMEKCNKRRTQVLNEISFHFTPIKISKKHSQLVGYFQSEKYFMEISVVLRNFLRDKLDIPKLSNGDAIAIQIRLGDMARNPQFRRVHGLINDDYVLRSLELLKSSYENLIVYGDDLELIEKELPLLAKSKAKYASRQTDLKQFAELASSPNIVISNSTFGWWAAWLGEGNVVAPKQWFSPFGLQDRSTKDLYIENWNVL